MSLYGDKTFENLLSSAMSRVSGNLDKREGSLVYNGNAPAMAELAQLYIGLDFVFSAAHITTAPREYLVRRAADFDIFPKAASAAVFRAEFNTDVPIGARFSSEDLNFCVTGRMPDEDTDAVLSYELTCETCGSGANTYSGDLIPIEYIGGLTTAKIAELLIPADDEEDTEVFRQRVLGSVRSQPFGGNIADYRQKALAIPGVGAVKVQPVWNADSRPAEFIPSEDVASWFEGGMVGVVDDTVREWISAVYTAASLKKLTVGGTVRLVIMASDNSVPTEELIDRVQSEIDPVRNAGEGMGLAPIGHVVKVDGVGVTEITVNTSVVLDGGWSVESAKPHIENVIDRYFSELAAEWQDAERIAVRISQIESRILNECSAFILDISDTSLNGSHSNIVLDGDSIPVRGDVNVS